jgi:hypothetical protein
MGLSSGDAALSAAAHDHPEELHLVNDVTRGSIEEQLMAYLTVFSSVVHFTLHNS